MNPARSSAVLAASGLASAAAVIVLAPFLIAQLGIDAYGVWVLATAVSGLLMAVDVGVGSGVNRLLARARAEGRHDAITQIVSTALLLKAVQAAGAGALAWVLVPAIAARLAEGDVPTADVRSALQLAVLAGIATSIAGVFNGVLIGSERFGVVAAAKLIPPVGVIPLAVAIVALGGGVVELSAAALGLACLLLFVLVMAAARATPCRLVAPRALERATLRRLLAYGVPRQWSYASQMVAVYYERLLVGVFAGTAAAAEFGPGSALVAGVASVLVQAISPVAPMLTRIDAVRGREELAEAYGRILRGYAVVVVGILGLFAAIAVPFIDAWLGSGFDRTPGYVQLLAAAFAARVLAEVGFGMAQAAGRPELEGHSARVVLALLAPGAIVLLATVGAGAAGAATASAMIIGTAVFFRHVRRWEPRSFAVAPGAIARPCAAAAGLAAAFALANALALPAIDDARALAAAIAAAEAVLFVALYVVLAGHARRLAAGSIREQFAPRAPEQLA